MPGVLLAVRDVAVASRADRRAGSPARPVKARRVVALLVVALAVYFVLIGYRGINLLGERRPVLKVLGVAVLCCL